MNIIILISTPDARGLVHKISSNLLEFNIEKNDEFVDKESGQFFMRTEISVDSAKSASCGDFSRSCKNAESSADSANPQNLVKNQSREAQPLASSGEGEGVVREGRGERLRNSSPLPLPQKNARGKKGESKADLSAQARGEIDSANLQNLQGGLPRRFCESARNDKFLDSSHPPLPHNDKNKDLAESSINTIYHRLHAILPKNSFLKVTPKRKKSLIIFATKESHCLGDLLLKNYNNELNIEIKAVISNHSDLGALVGKFHIPYFHISHEKADYENEMLQICANFTPDFIVLAKYMRILRPSFIKHYENRIINIHHSFLPAFIGANPYKQAYNRGVKIIGATAHFVTSELDSGPIICQDILQVNHTFSWQDMQKAGRNIERVVLARAVELAIDERIFIHNNKTIIF